MVLAVLLGVACGGSTRSSGSTSNAEGGSAGAGDGVGGAAGTSTSRSGGASQGGSSTIAGAGGEGVTGGSNAGGSPSGGSSSGGRASGGGGTGGAATGGSSAGGADVGGSSSGGSETGGSSAGGSVGTGGSISGAGGLVVGTGGLMAPTDPCAGLTCGDACTPYCPPGEVCITVLGVCDAAGACVTGSIPSCGAGGAAGEGGGTGGASGAGGVGECASDADCVLYADCCTGCIAVPTAYLPEVCPEACVVTCPEAALARCVIGECLVEVGCNDSAPCPVTQYCDYADDLCGRGEPAGICRERPIGCAVPAEPVCGCGATSPATDRCMLSLAGMDVDAELVASGDTCVSGVTPDPATLGVWYYGWMGGNLSFLEIALCADGRALYQHATAPEDPDPTVAEGTYTTTSPTTFTLTLEAVSSMDGTVLEYDSERDRLDRSPASDGYDSSGVHIEREALTWITPVLSCE